MRQGILELHGLPSMELYDFEFCQSWWIGILKLFTWAVTCIIRGSGFWILKNVQGIKDYVVEIARCVLKVNSGFGTLIMYQIPKE